MIARDVMVRDVVTVGTEATIQEAARLMVERSVSALPVVEGNGRLIGIVSEGDLIRRTEIGTERRRSWWLDMLTSREVQVNEFVKANALKVKDVMSSGVISASETTALTEIATLLEKNGIKRVPIVRDGRLVGVVSRANLVRALASAPSLGPVTSDDEALQERVTEQIRRLPGGMPWLLNVAVRDGTVDLWGAVASDQLRRAIRVAAESTPGVKAVKDNMCRLPVAVD